MKIEQLKKWFFFMFVTMACYRRVKDYGSFNSFISLRLIITEKIILNPLNLSSPLVAAKWLKINSFNFDDLALSCKWVVWQIFYAVLIIYWQSLNSGRITISSQEMRNENMWRNYWIVWLNVWIVVITGKINHLSSHHYALLEVTL